MCWVSAEGLDDGHGIMPAAHTSLQHIPARTTPPPALQCVLKTCLDYDRGCSQCDPATPVICAACKRYHTLDPATGQVG